MQWCPYCDKVYDESEYGICPYCSGQLEEEVEERFFKICPNCGGVMYWDDYWLKEHWNELLESRGDCYSGSGISMTR